MQPEASPLRKQAHEGVMGLSDFVGQLFDIAAGQFRIDASLAGVLQLDFYRLKVDHSVPLFSGAEPVPLRNKINMIRFVLQLFLLFPWVPGIFFNKWGQPWFSAYLR
jgi:hypothetical protein